MSRCVAAFCDLGSERHLHSIMFLINFVQDLNFVQDYFLWLCCGVLKGNSGLAHGPIPHGCHGLFALTTPAP